MRKSLRRRCYTPHLLKSRLWGGDVSTEELASTFVDKGKGQADRAIADYTQALVINPRLALAYTNRGLAYHDKGQYDQALADYEEALAINPSDAEAYTNRGFVYMVNLGNKTKACADWKRACELGECRNYNLAKVRGLCS